MISPYEVKDRQLNEDFGMSLETMIDAALRYSAYDNTTYCTLYLIYLGEADIKVLAKYAEAGYKIGIKTAHHCDDTDDIEVTVCYYY